MQELGYDMFDINDRFYQDICTPFDSPNGTDMLLSDRINYIYKNDDTQCQPNCQLSHYSLETKYLNCSCLANNDKDTSDINDQKEKFSAKKIYESFYEVLKYSNYDIIKCYNLLLNINDITINIGSIIVIIYFSCYLICMLIYIHRGLIPLRIKLRNDINKNEKIIKKQLLNILFPPIKKNHVVKLSINQYNINNNNNNKKKNRITKKKFNIDLSNHNNLKESVVVYSSSVNRNLVKNKLNIDKYENIKIKDAFKINRIETEKNVEKVYSDFELNELEYIEAIKYDKRSFCQVYWATLKREHLIIFTFFNCHDYNLLAIKLSRFLFLLVGDMALNVFFFSDDSMHKIFLNYGKYDFFQQIPQITYSTIISQIIEVFLCFLSLTDKYIYKIKINLIEGKITNINKKIMKIVNIKLIIFYIFTFIIFLLYWYIISMFCAVYKNTQIHFIKDSIISFSICLIYPFAFYFISSALRVCSIRDKQKRFECIYKLSDIIPFF